MDRYPECYSTKDIEDLILLMYCISLDTRIQICQHDIKTCLQAIYNAVQPSCWIEEVGVYGYNTKYDLYPTCIPPPLLPPEVNSSVMLLVCSV